MRLTHGNYHGIKSKNIHDFYEYLHHYDKSNWVTEKTTFKLDFEEDFYKVYHSFILAVLHHKDFDKLTDVYAFFSWNTCWDKKAIGFY
jgi:hypothetical protein